MINAFPADPKDKTFFEGRDGVVYRYDATIRSWIKVATNTASIPVADSSMDGLMSAEDLRRLNRLVTPPPSSSITSEDCEGSFQGGLVQLHGQDDFVSVEGRVSVQNINDRGGHISERMPFHIHQRTYGYDFTLDMHSLVDELLRRGQIQIYGPTGPRGPVGDEGEPGLDAVLSGPPGEKGDKGTAPSCSTALQSEIVPARTKPGLKRALTGVKVVRDEDSPLQYALEFDRQVVGAQEASAAQFHIRQQSSSWVLAAVNPTATPQQVYYVDVQPILDAIRQKFLDEVQRLKAGYEEITQFWIQSMSDLFDEQKAALCCALQFAQSKTNSTHLRQHMESVAASALPDAQIVLHNRGDSECSNFVSGTALWPTIGQPDLCAESVESLDTHAAESSEHELRVDPLVHMLTGNRATLELEPGSYFAVISDFDVEIERRHYANLAIDYQGADQIETVRFLNKGAYDKLRLAKSAYEGLSVAFEHDGGPIGAYFDMLPASQVCGSATLRIRAAPPLQSQPDQSDEAVPSQRDQETSIKPLRGGRSTKPEPTQSPIERTTPSPAIMVQQNIPDGLSCHISSDALYKCSQDWVQGNCPGLVIRLYEQEYILVRAFDGERFPPNHPCLRNFASYGLPAIALPTFDRVHAILPSNSPKTRFRYTRYLNDEARAVIMSGEFVNPRIVPRKKAVDWFDIILFPDIT